jgi:hypothetical protein
MQAYPLYSKRWTCIEMDMSTYEPTLEDRKVVFEEHNL